MTISRATCSFLIWMSRGPSRDGSTGDFGLTPGNSVVDAKKVPVDDEELAADALATDVRTL